MPSWSWESPDWVEGTFERDTRTSERWMRLDDEEARERDVLDRLRERGSSLSGRVDVGDRCLGTDALSLGVESTASQVTAQGSPRPESDEREAA